MKHPHRYLLLTALLAIACQPSHRTPAASTPLESAYSDHDTLGPEEKVQLAQWEAVKDREIFADIDRWQISSIPDVIFEMPNLIRLSVSNCPVDSLDTRIGNLTALQELRLVNLNINSFPASLSKLTLLHTLDLSETCVTDQMWRQISTLPNLKVLILNHCGLELPPDGPVPPALDTLSLSGGGSMSMPGLFTCLARAKTLRFLDISGQGLTELPPDIRLLRQLRHINADYNTVERLPAWLPELDSLESLVVGMVYLSSEPPVPFPDVLFKMKHLRAFTISGNCVTVPDRFDELPQLKELGLHLHITELPPSVARLDLERLDISYCKLTTLPPGIQQMRGLRKLKLGMNDFGPDYLHAYFASAEFPELTHLSLRVNNLGTFPTAFCACSKLTCLDLDACGLEKEPPCLEGFQHLCDFNNMENPYLKRPHKVKTKVCPTSKCH